MTRLHIQSHTVGFSQAAITINFCLIVVPAVHHWNLLVYLLIKTNTWPITIDLLCYCGSANRKAGCVRLEELTVNLEWTNYLLRKSQRDDIHCHGHVGQAWTSCHIQVLPDNLKAVCRFVLNIKQDGRFQLWYRGILKQRSAVTFEIKWIKFYMMLYII